MIHAEFMTHRGFSRNAASSRAIPIQKMQEAVLKNPAGPVHWGANKSGMQANAQLEGAALETARSSWVNLSKRAVEMSEQLRRDGLHKQIANRPLEWCGHITVIATATDKCLRNFFALRAHHEAQPEFQVLAYKMLGLWLKSTPKDLKVGDWHIPMSDDFYYVDDDEWAIPISTGLKVATGRIARVSYLTHDGVRDLEEDILLHNRLSTAGHWSPFEHCAQVAHPDSPAGFGGNFGPAWVQYRKTFTNECQAPTDEELMNRLESAPDWAKSWL
jgi:thymidylate synthase ThyX